MKFKAGQRWVSQTEPQLGLGVISQVSGRRIEIRFEAAGEERTYAADTAPLSRVQFSEDDTVELHDGTRVRLHGAMLQNDLMFYAGKDEQGQDRVFAEVELSSAIQLHTPEQRLSSGMVDKMTAYRLRVRALYHRARIQGSPVKGLLGSRTSLLPHQVYIANEVAQRFAPRVLLADEVGLGKTIEAGMIIHQQLLCGLASRVLIIVPESLVNQWLIEMLRRFNLAFSIFDKSRLDSLEHDTESNPFESAQCVICPLNVLVDSAEIAEQAAKAGWDLMVVDEAHHLHWSESDPSKAYTVIENLARHSRGLLLLTATPEQAGIESHFARLRLLDPARFPSLPAFIDEESRYQALVPVVSELQQSTGPLSASLQTTLTQWLDEETVQHQTPEELIFTLLDRFGTGRIFFRNTRASTEGFPERHLNPWPLACPDLYCELSGRDALRPETSVAQDRWLKEDPRVAWLETHLKSLRPKKVLVICAQAATAVALEEYLELRCGIRGSVFHEGMTLLERDRAAAYFADSEQGAQVLICSEIGSEGRNFQFAHHLVLFDLPLNPDLLEQRIGRLDRIGQLYPIEIHVPYLMGTAQETLYQWIAEGLNSFTQSFSGGFAVYEKMETRLLDQLTQKTADFDLLIKETQRLVEDLRASADAGRDPLLELNSCRSEIANGLIEQIQAAEESLALKDFMEDMCEHYGVHQEDHSLHALILKPTDQMLTGHFPGLTDEEGITVTFNREHALRREEMQFLTWEHPIVDEALDMLISGEVGNATVATLKLNGLKNGTLLLEAYFGISVVAPRCNQLGKYLPTAPVRVLTDITGKPLTKLLSNDQLDTLCLPVKRMMVPQIIKHLGKDLDTLIAQTRKQANEALPGLKNDALAQMERLLNGEKNRLKALQKVNPAVRQEEIEWFETQLDSNRNLIDQATLELQALRLIVAVE